LIGERQRHRSLGVAEEVGQQLAGRRRSTGGADALPGGDDNDLDVYAALPGEFRGSSSEKLELLARIDDPVK